MIAILLFLQPWAEWFKEIQPLLLVGFASSLIWNAAVCWTQLSHIRKNMATKKDLTLANSQLEAQIKTWADEKFVTQREYAGRLTRLGPTHGSQT